jgi:hypothetical protein
MIMEENNALSIRKEQKKWIRKIRRTLENKKKRGDQEHIGGGRYCRIYKILPV